MEDNLKAARLIHQLILVASAAILAFVVSAERPSDDFRRALDELRMAKKTVAEWPSIQAAPLQRFYESNGMLAVLRAEFRSPSLVIGTPTSAISAESELGRNLDHASVVSLYEFFRTRPAKTTEIAYDIPPAELRNEVINILGHDPALDRNTIRVIIHDIPIEHRQIPYADPRYFDASELIAENAHGRYGYPLPHRSRRELSTAETFNIVKGRGLIVTHDGIVDALPALRAVWEVVESLDIIAAEKALIRKDREARRTEDPQLTLVGVTIRASTAVVAGPLLVLLLMCYLYVHIQRARWIITRGGSTISEVAWVAIFDSRLAIALTTLSLWMLPPLAAVWLIAVAMPSTVKTIAACLCVAGMLILAALLHAELRRLRSDLLS